MPDNGKKKRTPATNSERGFINPYNFVRWSSLNVHRCSPATHEKFAGLSGRIVVELTNVTPLCIPDPEGTTKIPIGNDKERDCKPLMRVDSKPYIPGSSLKGMLRSVAEAASNSCYSVFTDQMAVFRDNRKFAANFRHLGRLKKDNDNWAIKDANPPGGRVAIWEDRKELYENNADLPEYKKPKIANSIEHFRRDIPWYYLLKGMFGDTKRTDYDYDEAGHLTEVAKKPDEKPERNEGKPVTILWPVSNHNLEPRLGSKALDLYKKMIESKSFRSFNDKRIMPLDKWQEIYLKTDNKEIFWYRLYENNEEKNVVRDFGRNFRYKWAYDPKEALPEELHPSKCKVTEMCPCCAIFGMVSQEENNAFTGRLAIGPARWIGGNWETDTIEDHKILGSPKFSCRSFYLQPTNQQDFDVSEDEFASLDDEEGNIKCNHIRGRKFYWHHTKIWNKEMSYFGRRGNPEKTEQNACIEVLRPKAKFEFTVEFENLIDWELGLLLWTITLPDVEEGAHHLGLGKPIGLGTVELKIKRLDLICRDQRYSNLFDTGIKECRDISGYIEAFRKQLTHWNGKSPDQFLKLENIADLKIIMSQQYPDCHGIPISYPFRDPSKRKKRSKPIDGNVHPSELHYEWFCEAMEWCEPLVTIQQIASKQYQNQEDP